MPEFSFDPITSEDGVFAFAVAGSCSVPCTTVSVALHTDSCCLEVNNGTIYQVGDGIVTATATPPDSPYSCGTFTPYVNGTPNSAFVSDGAPITVTLQTDDEDCCSCCLVHSPAGTGVRTGMLARRFRSIAKGTTKGVLVLDPDALRKLIEKRGKTIRRSKPTSEPPPTSPSPDQP